MKFTEVQKIEEEMKHSISAYNVDEVKNEVPSVSLKFTLFK